MRSNIFQLESAYTEQNLVQGKGPPAAIQNQLIYILIRKIDGAVLPTILKTETWFKGLWVRNPTDFLVWPVP